jgi:hypothetical protein
LTVFHANDKLYRYKRLTMGLKPSQGELNAALFPVLAHIPNAHLIHDDLIVAARTVEDHGRSVDLCIQAISDAGMTLNAKMCQYDAIELALYSKFCPEVGKASRVDERESKICLEQRAPDMFSKAD